MMHMEYLKEHPESQARLFADRLKAFPIEDQDKFSFLQLKLMDIAPGSLVVVWEMDRDLDEIINSGEVIDGTPIYKRMTPSHCHDNVAMLCLSDSSITHQTGYGLSEDGLWRSHSWGFEVKRGKKRIIETTCKRLIYFGVSLPTPTSSVQ